MSEISGPYWDFYGGPLSNFAPSPLICEHPWHGPGHAIIYPTVENYYQAWKATNVIEHDLIATDPDTWRCKRRGNKTQLRPDWEEIKYGVMLAGLRLKFNPPAWVPEYFGIPNYREELLKTEGHWLREDSPTDFIWGYRHGGLNLLGLALMVVRQELAVE